MSRPRCRCVGAHATRLQRKTEYPLHTAFQAFHTLPLQWRDSILDSLPVYAYCRSPLTNPSRHHNSVSRHIHNWSRTTSSTAVVPIWIGLHPSTGHLHILPGSCSLPSGPHACFSNGSNSSTEMQRGYVRARAYWRHGPLSTRHAELSGLPGLRRHVDVVLTSTEAASKSSSSPQIDAPDTRNKAKEVESDSR